MKNTKICPKCGSSDIFLVWGNESGPGSGNCIKVGNFSLKPVPVDRYVCGKCGFTEEWIREEDIARLRRSEYVHEFNGQSGRYSD